MLTHESEKLQVPLFSPSVNIEPLQTFYQRQTSDSYNASGFSFYLKSPAMDALLDPEIWIRYKLSLSELVTAGIRGVACQNGDDTQFQEADYPPDSSFGAHLAFRQGNVMQRAMQSLVVVLNGFSLNCEPWKFIDPLNRLYVSDDQSRHIFSASGGAYDSGNCGLITPQDVRWTAENNGGDLDPAAQVQFFLGQFPGPQEDPDDNVISGLSTFPDCDYYYNPGFGDRCRKFNRSLRGDYRTLPTSLGTPANRGAEDDPITEETQGAQAGGHFAGVIQAGLLNTYTFEIYERLPMPPFKMYHNDGVGGVIPNIKDLIIRAGFTANIIPVIFQANYDISGDFKLDYANMPVTDCEIFLKWYTAPMGVSIPRELSIPMRKIDIWSNYKPLTAAVLWNQVRSVPTSIAEYNISLDAVPDLLLIYFRRRLDDATSASPCDYHYEMQNLRISLENHGGKMTQIQTIELYQKWLKYTMHGDFKEVCYDEWRKHQCIAVLKPEDYGIIHGPGYDNPIILGVQFDGYSYYNNPGMGGNLGYEIFSDTNAELVICSIYDKWSLMISANGIARAELTRVRTQSGTISTAANLQSLNSPNNPGIAGLMR